MKYGSIKAVCFVVLACVVVMPAIGDGQTVDLTSIIVESFNGDTTHEWNDGKHQRRYEFSWALNASKFATKSTDDDGNEVMFPLSAYVKAWPVAVFGFNRDDLKSFGIRGRFDRQGYNWIDVYPVEGSGEEGKPFEIPLPGRVRYFDLWVWSGNMDLYIDAMVRDYQGIVHTIHFGALSYTGWKNLRAHIPNNIRQEKRVLPNHAELKFIKFRIWTQPVEKVGDFYVYFKQLKALTDTFETLFDGDQLADPDIIPGLWSGGDGLSGSTGRQ
ncbi:MAG: flagellar filament outer layer protein FlaA [Treponema sp.]|jgi:hypothetical protein|nr:flagellar filament outer layer protein FlaA [Treponema sp.]